MPSPANVSPAFPKFFDGLLKRYGGSKQELAKEIGVSSAAVSHLAAGVMNPGVELCFRLAAATGVSAVEILQAAGRDELAELIVALFGKRQPRRIDQGPVYSPDELELLAKLRLVRPRSRRALRTLIDAAAFANGALELPPGHTARRLVQTRPRGQRLRLKA